MENAYHFLTLPAAQWKIKYFRLNPHPIGVVALLPLVVKITKNYIARKIKGEDVDPMLSYDAEIQEEMMEVAK